MGGPLFFRSLFLSLHRSGELRHKRRAHTGIIKRGENRKQGKEWVQTVCWGMHQAVPNEYRLRYGFLVYR